VILYHRFQPQLKLSADFLVIGYIRLTEGSTFYGDVSSLFPAKSFLPSLVENIYYCGLYAVILIDPGLYPYTAAIPLNLLPKLQCQVTFMLLRLFISFTFSIAIFPFFEFMSSYGRVEIFCLFYCVFLSIKK